jgi:hypothetical protein
MRRAICAVGVAALAVPGLLSATFLVAFTLLSISDGIDAAIDAVAKLFDAISVIAT